MTTDKKLEEMLVVKDLKDGATGWTYPKGEDMREIRRD